MGDTSSDLMTAVYLELQSALKKFPSFNSPHEGWAVVKEEMDELWEHVRSNTGRSTEAGIEAIQVAAMALRYYVDLVESRT